MKLILSLMFALGSFAVFAATDTETTSTTNSEPITGGSSDTTSSRISDRADGEYITMTGKVTKATGDSFHIKSADKSIKVTMDNYQSWMQDGFKVKKDDQVVVTGKVNHDLFAKKEINAGSVYVKNIESYFYADHSDDDYFPALSSSYSSIKNLPENTSADITGRVTEVNGREFTVDTGLRKVKVDTASMSYNPMDTVGFTKVNKGDKVQVSGIVDDSFFDEKELSANYIIELSDGETYSE